MNVNIRRFLLWGVLIVLLVGGIAFAFRPQPVLIDVATVEVRPLRVTIDDDGEVDVRDVYTLYAPLGGRLLRIQADAGDPVQANTTELARIEPPPPAFLDARTEAERRSAVDAAASARSFAAAELASAEANLKFASNEVERARNLIRNQTISQRTLDDSERAFRVARANVDTAKAQLKVREYELAQARSRLMPSQVRPPQSDCACIPVTAPVTGVVLRVLRRSEGVIESGTPLLEIGDPRNLEVVVDLLSEDAVKIQPGQRAIISGWGGPDLSARVRLIEPFGRTKISALGIEEQRVDVRLDPEGPSEDWSRLGHGYRVQVHVVMFEGKVAAVPVGALFRINDDFGVFVVREGRAKRQLVQIGHSNGLDAEIRGGLAAGDRVVLYPNDRIQDGVTVRIR